jgi:crotonobetainyl-CoA:carnitine CoA-transferase CaiB-like acyl-CoA transferase
LTQISELDINKKNETEFECVKKPGMLSGIKIIEVADETAEYCGLLLAGLGADVIKVESSNGNATRSIGPFYEDQPDRNKSLFFWNYNRGKRSVVLDLKSPQGKEQMMLLLSDADVLLDSTCGQLNHDLSLDKDQLAIRFPLLVIARMTPFGDSGPWSKFKGSDLVHLALGGVMMNCGYDPDPNGSYDISPIAPQMWHAYHIAGEQLGVGIISALLHREQNGKGQDVSCAVHEAVSKNTELDIMTWVMRRAPIFRQTCRHATESTSRVPTISHTKDGRWMMNHSATSSQDPNLFSFLSRYEMQADLQHVDAVKGSQARKIPGSAPGDEASAHRLEVIQRFVRSFCYKDLPWRQAQDDGLWWAPLRKPHENALDEHWHIRQTFTDVEHPELGRSFRYVTSKWLSDVTNWQVGKRAPLLGEHTHEVLKELFESKDKVSRVGAIHKPKLKPKLSARGKPFALQNVRILDFSWFLASAGGTRIAAALGADCLKVEWKANPDTRLAAQAPVGGRAARAVASAPLEGVIDSDMGGQFNNKNSGKRGLSLNIRNPKGLEIAKRLVAISDVVTEGFSPGVLDRLGLGYDVLKAIKPDIIYIQQSGMGATGIYGRVRTVGPVAAAFVGTSEMSGLPEPAMPAGWGYSYLDWMGAYGYALAIMGALFHRERTGKGQRIDSSQCEAGLFLAGVSVLDWSANGRSWKRYGNRSPYKFAAPHGAYRCAGDDRWIAIACFDQTDWKALVEVSGQSAWATDPRFSTLQKRLVNHDALDEMVTNWTQKQDAYDCMYALQSAGVAAGVCQTAEDRCDRDPQLADLQWLTEVTGTKIGRWPVAEMPFKLSLTPPYSGGVIDRGAPCYGEDNEYVLGELLGYSKSEILSLAEEGVI